MIRIIGVGMFTCGLFWGTDLIIGGHPAVIDYFFAAAFGCALSRLIEASA